MGVRYDAVPRVLGGFIYIFTRVLSKYSTVIILSGGVYFSDAGPIRRPFSSLAVSQIIPRGCQDPFRGSRCTRVLLSLCLLVRSFRSVPFIIPFLALFVELGREGSLPGTRVYTAPEYYSVL